MKTTITSISATMLAVGTLSAGIVLDYNFDNGETDFNNTFNENTGNMNYSATGGVNGTGAVTAQGGSANNSAQLKTAAGTFADNGNVLGASLYFKPRDGNVNERIRVGYATAGGDFSVGDYISATIDGSVGNPASLVIRGRQDGVGTIKFADGDDDFSLTSSNWYQLDATFTRDTGTTGQFTFNITLYDWGTDGLTGDGTTNIVDTYGGTISGLNTVWSSELSGGFQNAALGDVFGPTIGSGGLGIDNFSAVIPEPSSYALLTGVLGLTWVMVRRRRLS